MWSLSAEDSETGRVAFRMTAGAIRTIGRAPGADFIVDAALVSRLHCRLEAEGDVVHVVDLQSTNGTFVNDMRVDRGTLKDGDRLRVGRVELTISKSPPS
jgi:pSer/pThr/pTyr-binding forkhead associated (FHA) protein